MYKIYFSRSKIHTADVLSRNPQRRRRFVEREQWYRVVRHDDIVREAVRLGSLCRLRERVLEHRHRRRDDARPPPLGVAHLGRL